MTQSQFVVQEAGSTPNTSENQSNQQAFSNTINGQTVKAPAFVTVDANGNDAMGAAYGVTSAQLTALGSQNPGLLNLLAGIYLQQSSGFAQLHTDLTTTNSDIASLNSLIAGTTNAVNNVVTAVNAVTTAVTSSGSSDSTVAAQTASLTAALTTIQSLITSGNSALSTLHSDGLNLQALVTTGNAALAAIQTATAAGATSAQQATMILSLSAISTTATSQLTTLNSISTSLTAINANITTMEGGATLQNIVSALNPLATSANVSALQTALAAVENSELTQLTAIAGNTAQAHSDATSMNASVQAVTAELTAFAAANHLDLEAVITAITASVTGASTSALQTAGNASLATLVANTPALGQALAGSSVPVVLPAAQIAALTPPTSVSVLALPSTAATSALQTSANNLLTTIAGNTATTAAGTSEGSAMAVQGVTGGVAVSTTDSGTKTTASAMPAGGAGVTGWLSAIASYLSANLNVVIQAGTNLIGNVGVFGQNGTAIASATNQFPVQSNNSEVKLTSSFTRPANTTAYAAGQLLANSTTAGSVVPLTFSNAVRTAGDCVRIERCRVNTSSTSLTNASFKVHVFESLPVPTVGDAGAIDPSSAGVLATSGALSYVGSFSVSLNIAGTDGASGRGTADTGFALTCSPTAGTSLYGLVEVTAAYTPTSGETISVILEGYRT